MHRQWVKGIIRKGHAFAADIRQRTHTASKEQERWVDKTIDNETFCVECEVDRREQEKRDKDTLQVYMDGINVQKTKKKEEREKKRKVDRDLCLHVPIAWRVTN